MCWRSISSGAESVSTGTRVTERVGEAAGKAAGRSEPYPLTLVSVLPDLAEAVLGHGVVGRGVRVGRVEVRHINPRDFADDRHRTVDEAPFGGGAGMVLRADVLGRAIEKAKQLTPDAPVVALTAQGRRLNQSLASELSVGPGVILVAGRYEGFDQRFLDRWVDLEVSIGDVVLSGGELAAAVLVDSVLRLVPGVLGNTESVIEESFSTGLLEHPHYTRPAEVAGDGVPAVLLSGDHAAIDRYRRREALGRTWMLRPDLLAAAELPAADRALLAEFIEEFQAARREWAPD